MVQFIPSFPSWWERDKKKSGKCLWSTRIIRSYWNGRSKQTAAICPCKPPILSDSQNYCCSLLSCLQEGWWAQKRDPWCQQYLTMCLSSLLFHRTKVWLWCGREAGKTCSSPCSQPQHAVLNILKGEHLMPTFWWGKRLKLTQCTKSWTALVSSNFAKTIVQHPCIFKATGTRCLVLQILSTDLKQ